jgi:hypothetical protein
VLERSTRPAQVRRPGGDREVGGEEVGERVVEAAGRASRLCGRGGRGHAARGAGSVVSSRARGCRSGRRPARISVGAWIEPRQCARSNLGIDRGGHVVEALTVSDEARGDEPRDSATAIRPRPGGTMRAAITAKAWAVRALQVLDGTLRSRARAGARRREMVGCELLRDAAARRGPITSTCATMAVLVASACSARGEGDFDATHRNTGPRPSGTTQRREQHRLSEQGARRNPGRA